VSLFFNIAKFNYGTSLKFVTLKIVLLIGDDHMMTSPLHFTDQAKQAGIQFKTTKATVWWSLIP
jgi:hypothetical protein